MRSISLLLGLALLAGCMPSEDTTFARGGDRTNPDEPSSENSNDSLNGPLHNPDGTIHYPLQQSECPEGMLYVPPASYTLGTTHTELAGLTGLSDEELDEFLELGWHGWIDQYGQDAAPSHNPIGAVHEYSFTLNDGTCIDVYPEAGESGVDWIGEVNIPDLDDLSEILPRMGRRLCTSEEIEAATITQVGDWYPSTSYTEDPNTVFVDGICDPDTEPDYMGLYPNCRARSGIAEFMVKSEWSVTSDTSLALYDSYNGLAILPMLEEDIPDQRYAALGGLYHVQSNTPGNGTFYVRTTEGGHHHLTDAHGFQDHTVRFCADPGVPTDNDNERFELWRQARRTAEDIQDWISLAP